MQHLMELPPGLGQADESSTRRDARNGDEGRRLGESRSLVRRVGWRGATGASPCRARDAFVRAGSTRCKTSRSRAAPRRWSTTTRLKGEIAVVDDIARRLIPWKGFTELLRRPRRRWMGCHRDMRDATPLVRKDDQHEEQPERRHWDHEEIGGGDLR